MKNYLLLISAAVVVTMSSCSKDVNDDTNISSASLNSMSSSTDMQVVKVKNTESGKWNIKMNDIAAKAYASGSHLYPVNSLLVKEIKDEKGTVTGTATMFRTSGDLNSSNGWIYTEYDHNGNVIYDANKKGASCQSCHSQSLDTRHL